MTDKDIIDEMLERNNDDPEEIRAFERKVQSGVRKNIYKRSLIMIIAVSLLFFGIRQLYLYEKERDSWHLSDLEQLTDERFYEEAGCSKERMAEINAFLYAVAYYDLFVPDYSITKRNAPDFIVRNTYGVYEFNVKMINSFCVNMGTGSGYYGKDSSIVMENGKLIKTEDIMSLQFQDPFTEWWSLGDEAYKGFFSVPDPVQEITELPSSAYVQMDIRLKDRISIENALELQADYPSSRILYAVTYQASGLVSEGEILFNVCGFSMMNAGYDTAVSIQAMEKYPYITKQNEFGMNTFAGAGQYYESLKKEENRKLYAEQYRAHYTSSLKLFLNNDVLQYPENAVAEEALADISENGVDIIGMRMSLTKEDALRIMEEPYVSSFLISDIKMSRFDN